MASPPSAIMSRSGVPLKRPSLRSMLIAVGVYAAVATFLWRALTGEWSTLLPFAGTYGATAVLVAASELWLRMIPRRRALPVPPGGRIGWIWIMAVVLLDGGFTIIFWRTLLPLARNTLATTPTVLGSPMLASRLLNVAYGGAPITVLALAIFAIRWQGQWRTVWRLQWWDLGFALWLLGVAVGLGELGRVLDLSNVLPSPPLVFFGWVTPLVYGAQLLVNGLPEEILFRGILLRELLGVLRNNLPLALWVSAVAFNVSHIPSWVIGGTSPLGRDPWWVMGLWCLFPSQPTGLFFGYVFFRSKSISSVIVFHTLNTFIGIIP